MSNLFRSGYAKVVGLIAVLAIVIGIPLVILDVKSQQNLQQNAADFPSITIIPAWTTNQSANAVCTGANAVIHVIFTNTEPGGAANAMKVTVKDQQTGTTLDLGIVQPGATKTGDIATGKTSLTTGSVIFYLSWANGRSGTDTRTVSYSAITCHAPTNTPTPTQRITNTPTPTSRLTPTNTPTPTMCVTPGAVTNVRVSCSTNCTSQ